MGLKPVEKNSLFALKEVLLSPEKEQIRAIENRLDNPMERAKEISRALPEAISLSVMSGGKLSRTIQPVIDEALSVSVKNNPKAIADAIFPALGPGIRKAISATIMGMIQSLNHLLNNSFSFQGLKWRFEAFRTGRQFAEIVLLHTLIFQVEQLFLIHRDTGIVLEHVVAQNVIIQDPDLVSGMLTAIQDFVKDSFDTETGDEIETLRIGSDRSVWIEKGDHAFIAAVIKGRPPMELRAGFNELIEEIHLKAGPALENFNGDPFPFAIFRESLKDRLISREKQEKKKTSPLLWLIFTVIIVLSSFLGYQVFESHRAWSGYLDRLEAQKGIIVLSSAKKDGIYRIKGLADPLAPSPDRLLTKEDKQVIRVKGDWTPFYSLDREFVHKRSLKILNPPAAVTLELSGTTLAARGEAFQAWIRMFTNRAAAIPGVSSLDLSGLVNLDRKNLERALKQLEQLTLYFDSNSIRLVKGQEDVLTAMSNAVKRIQDLQTRAERPVQILLMGHTDSSGSEKHNLKLSRDRAETVLSHLIVQGVNPSFITLSGVSTKIPLKVEGNTENRQFNRAVTFKTFYQAPATGGR